MASMSPTKVIVLGDLHCGSISGLTPPNFETGEPFADTPEWKAWELRTWHYAEFVKHIEMMQPFDICIANGDLIDGNQSRSNGQDLIVQDRNQQAKMAIQCLKKVNAKEYFFTLGTPYHTGQSEDFEDLIAEEFNSKAEKEVLVNVNGTVIHAAHHAPGSQNPNTRQNRLGVEASILNKRFAEGRLSPRPHLFFRSHAHYSGGYIDGGMEGRRVPSLQMANKSKYGRSFAMDLDYGFLVVDVYGPGLYSVGEAKWQPRVVEMQTATAIFDAASKARRKTINELLLKGRAHNTGLPAPDAPRGIL